MDYISTRGNKQKKRFAQGVLQGIAEDKGLFVPETIPALDKPLKDLVELPYQAIAYEVMKSFAPDFTEDELNACINQAYDQKFSVKEIAPIVSVGDACFLELYHGKTSAFKDMALSILPHLLVTAMKKEGETSKIVILTATSGDTGKAALEGFADVESVEIFVFYPEGGVSQIQKMQMLTQEGDNTHVYSIHGNFDDAQTAVKHMFNDPSFAAELREKGYKLSSANSINPGRLIPQVVYYVYTYTQLVKKGEIKLGEAMNVVVPTGNFGNILAAYYAKSMGVPIKKLICASNENNVLTDFIRSGKYHIKDRDFYLTNSPSMDILISSNLERLLFHLSDGNGDMVQSLMETLEKEGVYEINPSMKESLKDFYGGYADENQVLKVIKDLYKKEGYLMDTHTAVAYKVYENYKQETGDQTKTVIVSTASPYKFTKSVLNAINEEGLSQGNTEFEMVNILGKLSKMPVPEGLKDLDKKKIRHGKVVEVKALASVVKGDLK